MIPPEGGDPPCISSGNLSSRAIGVCDSLRFRGGLGLAAATRPAVGRRFAAGRRLALVRRLPDVRRFEVTRLLVALRRFAAVRRFAVVRRFSGPRFFLDERELGPRFLRFAMYCLLFGQTL
jgi:hypothetical protein